MLCTVYLWQSSDQIGIPSHSAIFLAHGHNVKHSHMEETHEEITPNLLYFDTDMRPVTSSQFIDQNQPHGPREK